MTSSPVLVGSTSESSRKSRLTGNSNVSNASIRCRICQLTEAETGEPVKTSDCRCKRDLACVHRSCLTDWVNYKGNNTCEVCKSPFASVPAPILTETTEGEQTVMHALFREYSLLRPMTLYKRIKLGGLLAFLTIVTTSVGISMTSVMKNAKNMGTYPRNGLYQLRFTLLLYCLCIMGAVTVCTLSAWIVMEISYSTRRRRIQRQAIQIATRNQTSDINTV